MPKTPNVMGFSGSINGTTKNPGFLDFGFCQCKWAYRFIAADMQKTGNLFCLSLRSPYRTLALVSEFSLYNFKANGSF